MRIQHRSSKKLPIIITSLVVIAALMGGHFVYHHYSTPKADRPTSQINYKKPTKAQINAGQQIKKQVQDSASKSTSGTDSSSSPSSSSLQTQITTATVQGSTLYVRNDITGIYQDGSCTLTLTQGSQTVTETAGIQPLPQSSTCKGFNIPTSKLSSGTWNIKLVVTINSQTASAASSVEVK